MDLYLLDAERNPIKIIDDYMSLVWTERFQDCGDFELKLRPNVEVFSDFSTDRFLMKSDSNDIMLIESREITNDSDEGVFLNIKGRSALSLLSRRLNLSVCLDVKEKKEYVYSGDVVTIVNSLVNDNIINPFTQVYAELDENCSRKNFSEGAVYLEDTTRGDILALYDSMRKIPNFILGSTEKLGIESEYTCTEITDLLTVARKICVPKDVGFKVILNPVTKNFEFYVVKGVDRSLSQTEVDPLYFSEEFSNILNVSYYEDISSYKNVAYSFGSSGKADYAKYGVVAGGATIDDPIYPGYSKVFLDKKEPTGINRMELVCDSDAELSDTDPETNKSYGDYTDWEQAIIDWVYNQCIPYQDAIIADGKKELEDPDNKKVTDATGEIDTNVLYQFGVDYFLGDYVEFDTGYALNVKSIVDEVVYSYDDDGITVTPNFRDLDEEVSA